MDCQGNIAAQVYANAAARPGSPAIVTNEGHFTYWQVRHMAGLVVAYLKKQGVKPGDIVGVSMAHNPLHVVTLLALAQMGAVSVPLHVAISVERRMLAARRFSVAVVVSGRAEWALPDLPFISLANLNLQGSEGADLAVYDAGFGHPLNIAISSGTSGDPKGMVISHGVGILRIDQTHPDVHQLDRLLVLDLQFMGGFHYAFCGLVKGAAIVIPGSMTAPNLLRSLVCLAVTQAFISPGQAQSLCDILVEGGLHCPNLVRLRIGGGVAEPALLEEVQRKLTKHVEVVYSSTEALRISCASVKQLASEPRTAGRPVPWANVQVVDAQGRPQPPNVTGHLRIRSNQLVSGYVDDADRTARHFREGWFYPGDMGRINLEGLLFIEGRSDEMINIGGQLINPYDVESVVSMQQGVGEVGAFVYRDAQGRSSMAVAVVSKEALSMQALSQQVQAILGPLSPVMYFMVSELPRTLTGKLQRSALSAGLSAKPDGSECW